MITTMSNMKKIIMQDIKIEYDREFNSFKNIYDIENEIKLIYQELTFAMTQVKLTSETIYDIVYMIASLCNDIELETLELDYTLFRRLLLNFLNYTISSLEVDEEYEICDNLFRLKKELRYSL